MPLPDTPPLFDRDGTSQATRRLASLAADSVGLDERGLQDWLAFADAFARELVYFDTSNQPAGDWSGLLHPGGVAADLAEIERFVANPAAFSDDSAYRRPHFVLLLVLLSLLELSRQRMNRLTAEHIEYYYGQVLALQKKPATPDVVSVIAKLANGAGQTLLPKGTLLAAGKDSLGGALAYRTDDDLIVSRAQVKDLYTVFVNKRVTGIREARENTEKSGADPRLAMFQLVYGDPANDGQMAVYDPTGKAPDAALIDKLGAMVDFVGNGLFLDQAKFSQIMALKNRRQKSATADWKLINGFLQKMGRIELNNAAFTITPADSPAFWNNYKLAFNNNLPDFHSLPGNVISLEDLYGGYLVSNRQQPDIVAFIRNELHLEPAEFETMMAKKQEVDSDWRIVNGLLEAAGQRKRNDANYVLLQDGSNDPYKRASSLFDQNLAGALGTLDFSPFTALFKGNASDLDRFAAALDRVRAYFFCTLDDFAWIARLPASTPSAADWDLSYDILAAAYAQKVYADRRRQLQDIHTGLADKPALEAMLRLASAERTLPLGDLLNLVASWWPAADTGMAVYKGIYSALTAPNPPAYTDWQNAAVNLELAWRAREGKAPVAQQEEWLLLHANDDATSVESTRPGDTPRWRTFGQRRDALPKSQPPAAQIGWSIASPALCLSEGLRKVTLTLVFPADSFASQIAGLIPTAQPGETIAAADWPLLVQASSAKGWMAPDKLTMSAQNFQLPSGKQAKSLQFGLEFGVAAPALAALPGSPSAWPMLRLLLQPQWQTDSENFSTPYPLLRPLVLDRVLVRATVAGLKNLALANDDGSLAAGKPFEPFGSSPASGSALRFTHAELAVKRLKELNLNLEWMKVPAPNLATHYANYGLPASGNPNNSYFTARFSLLDHGTDIPLNATAKLFEDADATKAHAISLGNVGTTIQTNKPGYAYQSDHAPINAAAPASWLRYWRLELNDPDFQHGNHARVAAAKSVELATAITACLKPGSNVAAPNAGDYKVNPPYTPKLKTFSVDYGCELTLVMDTADPLGYGKGDERIFHHHAFGMAEIQPDASSGMYRFMPAYDNEGELYLGLEHATVPGELAILFQMAEGSANPDLPARQPDWSYLSGDRWLSLADGSIVADSTRGLAQSGIIRFRLPAARPSTLLPGARYWLRAAVAKDCDAICDCIAIRSQAVSATWLESANTAGHLNAPLAAGSIAKTAVPVAGIASVSQPYTSTGGKPAERDEAYQLRVSERLRHKQRALTAWDYERLVLERFPAIYKAKCIPAQSADPAHLGKVDVIVIPDIRGQLPFNPFEPKATVGQIGAISDFMATHVSPLAEVSIRNAYYVPVRVRFAVRFLPEYDPAFYKPRLNEALNRFLSPWAYDEGNEISIGGSIHANAIINFLERQPGVDYIAELKLFKSEDRRSFKLVEEAQDGNGYRVRSERADGVLVADPQHEIDLITDTRFTEQNFSGIGYMKIELDFVVG
ncbi:MAG: baseplate J/gp47 family protein [Rhodocyclaceae bacterium]|nr:baseplate J/gp47 family protein [Rhodocyclaceae bacterium]